MCLLSYADNKNAVAQIGESGNREGARGYTIFPRKLKSKKKFTERCLQMNYRSLQMNYRSLQMNLRFLQTMQYIPIIYSIKKIQKEVKIATLWPDHLILKGGGLQILSGQGGGGSDQGRGAQNVGS